MKLTPSSCLLLMLAICLPVFSGCESKINAHILAPTATVESAPVIELVGELSPAAAQDGSYALRLINNYNSRNMGTPAVRRVVLELISDGEVTQTFTVVNLWSDGERQTRMLFLLEDPQGLRGTDYLLVEDKNNAQESPMRIHLYLPAGQQLPLEVKPDNFDEGLLGSDFSYNDLRMLLPVAGYNYRLVGQTTLLDEPVWVIEARPSSLTPTKSHRWTFARFYLAKRFPLLLGADYFAKRMAAGPPPSPFKKMRVESFEQIAGIWTATRISMSSAQDRSSLLVLKNIAYRVKLKDSAIFSSENLPRLAQRFRPEWFQDNRAGH